MAYFVTEENKEQVLAYLDERERGGFIREEVTFYTKTSDNQEPEVKQAIIYRATEDNTLFLGEASLDSIATQIFESSGPSGPNIDYLTNLAESMRQMGVEDNHLFEIEHYILTHLQVAQTKKTQTVTETNNNNQ